MIKNKIKIMQLLIFIFISFMLIGCMQQQNMNDAEKIRISSFETDKKSYGSYEEMKVTAVVKSPVQIQDVNARLTGIKPYNHAYIDESELVDINKGDNEIILVAKTPHCTSGCGGIYPGPYSVDIELAAGEDVLASSNTTIELVSS